MVRGLIHLHTHLSGDSRATLDEYVSWGKTLGLDFMIFTEHQGACREEDLAGMPDQREGVLLLWTLERDDGAHHYIEIGPIRALFHPGEPGPPRGSFNLVEVWNQKREGPYPSRRLIKKHRGKAHLFGAPDAHSPRGNPPVLVVNSPKEPKAILAALARGDFYTKRGSLRLYPDGRVEGAGVGWLLWELWRRLYITLRWFVRKTGLRRPLRALARRLR